MESHEVLRQAIEPIGAKKAAHELRVSSSLVYKWCEEDTSGARNPLDRIKSLIECTGSRTPVEWLCRQAPVAPCHIPYSRLTGGRSQRSRISR